MNRRPGCLCATQAMRYSIYADVRHLARDSAASRAKFADVVNVMTCRRCHMREYQATMRMKHVGLLVSFCGFLVMPRYGNGTEATQEPAAFQA